MVRRCSTQCLKNLKNLKIGRESSFCPSEPQDLVTYVIQNRVSLIYAIQMCSERNDMKCILTGKPFVWRRLSNALFWRPHPGKDWLTVWGGPPSKGWIAQMVNGWMLLTGAPHPGKDWLTVWGGPPSKGWIAQMVNGWMLLTGAPTPAKTGWLFGEGHHLRAG
jgi:hypothetical protein